MEMAGALWGKYAILFCVLCFLFFVFWFFVFWLLLHAALLPAGDASARCAAVCMTMTAVGFQLSPISLQRRVARLLFYVLVLRFLFLTV